MRTTIFLASLGLATIIASAAVAQDAPLPDGPGKDQFVADCSVCHAVTMATSQRKTAAQWAATVDQMIGQGATVSDDDHKAIVGYLGKNFAPAEAASASQPQR